MNNNSVIISKPDLQGDDNMLAHEFNHVALFLAIQKDEKDFKKLLQLYNKAKDNDKFLDYYAAQDHLEYFAQGYEAYVSMYKPHKLLIRNNEFDQSKFHIRSTLKHKDPELYEFIEYCIKKYGKPQIQSAKTV